MGNVVLGHITTLPNSESRGERTMKRIAMFGICAAILVVLPGCMSMRTNTRAPGISEEAVPRLQIEQPVAFRNSAPSSGDIVIGKWVGWTVYADLHKYTESSIAAAKNVLERQNISVKDDADKVLELSVYSATSEQGMLTFKVTTALRVRTGDGLVREYKASQKHGSGYGTTSAMQRTHSMG